MEESEKSTPITPVDPELARLDSLAKLLDNQFAIPGTNYRFGLDGLVGLVPYLGDMAGFVVSSILMRTMVKKGASPWLMLRMMWNFILDAVIGIVPVIGDLFDFGYKANRRNVDLMKAYYADGKAKPSAKGSLAFLGLAMLLIFAAVIWAIWKFAGMILAWIWAAL